MTPRILFGDFETYYAKDYTLRDMTPAEYILNPRFETIGCAMRELGAPRSTWVDGPDFPSYITQFDPNETTFIAFNNLFDGAILAWIYGFVPKTLICTMGMARALRGHILTEGASLRAVAVALGLRPKGNAIIKAQGLRRADLVADRGLWREYQDYAILDNDLNFDVFAKLIPEFPWSERRIMDLVLRCAIEPRFHCDGAMLEKHVEGLKGEKEMLLAKVALTTGGVSADLMSSAKFKLQLESLGVAVEMKMSPTGRLVPAFAKTDEFMEELKNHEDARVQVLAAARLGLKSTIEETRAAKMARIAGLQWWSYRDGNPRLYSGGTMPIPLGYGVTHTGRLNGTWGMNMQNLPTDRGSKGKSKLRKALCAPPNHQVVKADLGQIECRVAGWLCGAHNLLLQFRNKQDPYAILATAIFGFVVDRKVHKTEGFIGKTGVLGLGYGCGPDKFYDMVLKLARLLGVDLGTMWTKALAEQAVKTYRSLYSAIANGWRRLDSIIDMSLLGGMTSKFGPCTISRGKVALPNGLFLNYDNPSVDPVTLEKTFGYGKTRHKIYGAKFLENITQALSRIIVMNAALRIHDRLRRTNWSRFVLQAHDELVFIIPDEFVEDAKKIIHEEMTRPPTWARDIPLTCDIQSGPTYGDLT